MKVDLSNIAPDAIPGVGKGAVLRDTRNGPVVQKKGFPRKSTETQLQRDMRIRWAFACAMASSPGYLDRATADFFSQGTEQTWRDVLTAAALGRYVLIRNPDGTDWPLNNVPKKPLT